MCAFPLKILGTCTATPEAHQDCTCMLLDHNIMIDTGFAGVVDLLNYGEDPNKVDYVFITHCHHDHYMGLPQLIFYHRQRDRKKMTDKPLVIIGPKPDIKMVVERSLHFLRVDAFEDMGDGVQVVPLSAGGTYETERFTVSAGPTIHPVMGLCYRFTEKATGRSVVFTGDTAFHNGLVEHSQGADLLVHEASYGPHHRGTTLAGGHSGSPDAAEVARQAGVKRLALVHYYLPGKEATLAAAQAIFAETIAPPPGEELVIGD